MLHDSPDEFVPDVCLVGTWCLCCTMLFCGPRSFSPLPSHECSKAHFVADAKGNIHVVPEAASQEKSHWWPNLGKWW